MVETETAVKCSKCGGELDTKGKDKWCRKCRADYQRDYTDRQYEEAKKEGYSDGFAAGYAECRLYIMQKFNPFPLHNFTGVEVLNTARAAKPSNSTGNGSGIAVRENNVPLR